MVDLRTASLVDRIAVLCCAGLLNRPDTVASNDQLVYTIMNSDDLKWWNVTRRPSTPATSVSSFLKGCMQSSSVEGRWISYNSSSQKLVIPVIITLSGVLDAVPLEPKTATTYGGSEVVFDAITRWSPPDALAATQYVYRNYGNMTTGMSKMNPGLDVHQHPVHPNITGDPNPGLADYIVKEKLFNFYLNDGSADS